MDGTKDGTEIGFCRINFRGVLEDSIEATLRRFCGAWRQDSVKKGLLALASTCMGALPPPMWTPVMAQGADHKADSGLSMDTGQLGVSNLHQLPYLYFESNSVPKSS